MYNIGDKVTVVAWTTNFPLQKFKVIKGTIRSMSVDKKYGFVTDESGYNHWVKLP